MIPFNSGFFSCYPTKNESRGNALLAFVYLYSDLFGLNTF